jgi:3-hydroxyacyl-[acyl-carrier-protein] dehydratase
LSEISQAYCLDATHPCFAGHFPGNPIIPGVILLDLARALLVQWLPGSRIKTITQAKFLHPVHPEQVFTIYLTQIAITTIKFECKLSEQRVMSGSFLVEHNNE